MPASPPTPRCRGSARCLGVEAGENLGLPREPGEAVWVVSEGVGEDLQGNLAVELGVGGLPDLAHPAFAEESGDVVVAERCAGLESHPYVRPCLLNRCRAGRCPGLGHSHRRRRLVDRGA